MPGSLPALTSAGPTAPLVWISEALDPAVAERLSAYRVVPGYGPEGVDFSRVAGEVEAVIVRAFPFPADLVESAPRLRVIARHGVGYDAVAVDTASARGVFVTNTPGANRYSVAELAIGLLINAFHRLPAAGAVTSKKDALHHMGKELRDAVLTIVGAGDIGTETARMASALGMRVVLAITPGSSPERVERLCAKARCLDAEVLPLAEAAAACDALSVHVPLTPETHHLVDADLIARMRTDAVVVNTARGGVVDDRALAGAIREGRLGGAGLDCTEVEPVPADHELRDLPSVQVLPHIGSLTHQTMRRVGLAAAEAVDDVLSGRTPAHVVNPEAFEVSTVDSMVTK
ncbi:NAD(P)-dependent oxidoreductase [Brevibacterium litoralis]|uniref:NAD(P)-dependent oxidoreductase n=1 Tax=Brevibacterium litoralis TaxID=3138935 RepID=UPI0032EC7447